jgi:hypothetical protein
VRTPPEFRCGNVVVRPAHKFAFELSITDAGSPAVALLEAGEVAMLANAMASMLHHNSYDPLASVPDGGESGQPAKV